MRYEIRFAGSGGQGVILAALIAGEAAALFNPAVERGARALTAKQTARGTVLVDAAGRTQGVLVGEASPGLPPGTAS